VAALRDGAGPVVRLHPGDAAAAGVGEGDPVRVVSARGGAAARVAIDEGLPAGTAFLPFHAGPLLEPGGWANALTPRALDPLSFQPELKHTAVRVEPAPAVAVAGGALAGAVVAALGGRGVPAALLGPDELERTPARVRRAQVAEAPLTAEPWWEVARRPPGAAGTAVLDLAAGPEPLAALPALAGAGWAVAWRGERWLPGPVRRLVEAHLAPDGGGAAGLVVGAPAPAPCRCPVADAVVLVPGGRLGLHGPLSGDPSTLAALLAGELGPRAALRRVVAALTERRSLVVAGDPLGDPEGDAGQGVDVLLHEDRAAGTAQVWRLAGGQVLGVAAVLAPDVAADVEALWLADPEPALLRRRFPLR
jgi:formylmethanofuran dehydrogenase subunit D